MTAHTNAEAEAAVQAAERRVMAPLRDQTFFSHSEACQASRPLLEALNQRPIQKMEGSRRSPFEELDRPALSPRRGGYTKNPDHMPVSHQAHLEWTSSRLIAWGANHRAREGRLRPEAPGEPASSRPGLPRSCLGLKKLTRTHPAEWIEAACRRALVICTLSYRSVKSILATGLDRTSPQSEISLRLPRDHQNLCGAD